MIFETKTPLGEKLPLYYPAAKYVIDSGKPSATNSRSHLGLTNIFQPVIAGG